MKTIDLWSNTSSKPALILGDGNEISYNKLSSMIDLTAIKMNRIASKIVLIPMYRSLETVSLIYACIRLRKTFVPLDPRLSIESIKEIANHFSDATYIGKDNYEIFFQNENIRTNVFDENFLFIGFTSGTTGSPKGFIRSHISWIKSFETMGTVNTNNGDMIACLSPLHYSLGLYALIETLYNGKTFLMSCTKLEESLTLVQRSNKISIFGTPSILRLAMQKKDLTCRCNFQLILTGEIFDKKMKEALFEAFPNISLLSFYGSSETSFIAYQINEISNKQILFENVKIEVDSSDNSKIGEIIVSSPMIFEGYYENGYYKKSGDTFATGDIGYLNGEQLYILGRKDERINRGGEKVFPSSIESILHNHPQIKMVKVLKDRDALLGEKVIAYISFRNSEVPLVDLNSYLKEKSLRKVKIDKLYDIKKLNVERSGKMTRIGVEDK